MSGSSDPYAWRAARIAARRAETDRAATLVLEVDDWPGHVAGQHVDVRLTAEDGYQATRAYSIASAPSSGAVELTVERIDDGEVSPYLVDIAEPGDELEVRGPIGGWFTWRPATARGPLVLVAGGSGLVPLMAMVREAVAAEDGVDVRIAVSTRTAGDLLYAAELTSLAGRPTVRLLHTLTRDAPDGWTGATGRLGPGLIQQLVADLPTAPSVAYVCGSSGFVDHAADLLAAAGVMATGIRAERFGPTT